MKAIWKGSLSFGLVNIPVSLYSAVEQTAFKFRLLCKKCKAPIHYKRFCEGCPREVPWNETVKGVEVSKGEFIIVDKEMLDKIKPEKTQTIDIVEFVDSYQIEPIYFDKHYYLAPQKAKEKAFFLFKEVLSSTAKVAIARFVLRDKQHTCAVSAFRQGMLLTTLNYKYEVRDIAKIEELKEQPKVSKQEYDLAKQLIEKLHEDSFNIGKFKDDFSDQLTELVVKLEKGEKITAKKVPKKQKEKSLVEALRASIK